MQKCFILLAFPCLLRGLVSVWGAHTACNAHTTWGHAQPALGAAPNTMHNMFPAGVLPGTSLTRPGAEGATSPLAEIPAFPCGFKVFGVVSNREQLQKEHNTSEKYQFIHGNVQGTRGDL